jgi:hypothetical protein
MRYTDSHANEFGPGNINKLSGLGKSIIDRFINENQERERLLKQKEQDIEDYRKSKHELDLNKWKYNDYYGKEFEKMKIDEVYYFKKNLKPNYFIKDSFKIPKRDGNYFEKLKCETNFKEE